MKNTQVKELMTPNPVMISPDATLQEAAQKMEQCDCGILPVGSDRDIQGMITDRDIVIRAVSKGKNAAEAKVKDCMTKEVHSCGETKTLKEAADIMSEHHVSRLLVKDTNDNLVGILSLGAILRKDTDLEELAEVVEHARGNKSAA